MHVDGMETHLCWGKLWVQRVAPGAKVTVSHTEKHINPNLMVSFCINSYSAIVLTMSLNTCQRRCDRCGTWWSQGGPRRAGGRVGGHDCHDVQAGRWTKRLRRWLQQKQRYWVGWSDGHALVAQKQLKWGGPGHWPEGFQARNKCNNVF